MAETAQQQASTYFETSCRDHVSYPTNLIYRASYKRVLEAYKARLDKASPNLFRQEAAKDLPDVRFRDYDIVAGSEYLESKY